MSTFAMWCWYNLRKEKNFTLLQSMYTPFFSKNFIKQYMYIMFQFDTITESKDFLSTQWFYRWYM